MVKPVVKATMGVVTVVTWWDVMMAINEGCRLNVRWGHRESKKRMSWWTRGASVIVAILKGVARVVRRTQEDYVDVVRQVESCWRLW